MLKALPSVPTDRATNNRYSSASQFRIASLHFHDDIYNMCKKLNKLKLVDSIPSELARKLNGMGFAFTFSGKFEDGSYVPLPNISQQDMVNFGDRYQQSMPSAATTPQPIRRETRSSPVPVETNEIACLRGQITRQAVQSTVQQNELDAIRKALNEQKMELDKRTEQIENCKRGVDEKVQLLISGSEVYGLTRCALLSKVWHKNNPDTAKKIFGFASWKDTVYKLHALFDVLPPSEMPNKKTPVSLFEHYLMGYL